MDIRLAVLFTLGLAYTASALHSKYNFKNNRNPKLRTKKSHSVLNYNLAKQATPLNAWRGSKGHLTEDNV